MGLILIKIHKMSFTQPSNVFLHPILTHVLILHNMQLLQPTSYLGSSVLSPPVLLVQLASPTATIYRSSVMTVHWIKKC